MKLKVPSLAEVLTSSIKNQLTKIYPRLSETPPAKLEYHGMTFQLGRHEQAEAIEISHAQVEETKVKAPKMSGAKRKEYRENENEL